MPRTAGRRRRFLTFLSGLAVAVASGAQAQSPTPGGMPPPPGMDLAQSAAMRFPQPVRAGSLPGRTVLEPVESQAVIGVVQDVVRDPGGTVSVVMTVGGVLGFGARRIAVPIDAMVLLGADMEVAAFTSVQLRQFPTFTPAAGVPVPPDTILRVGLAKPSH